MESANPVGKDNSGLAGLLAGNDQARESGSERLRNTAVCELGYVRGKIRQQYPGFLSTPFSEMRLPVGSARTTESPE
jgi:hypothetical protein